MKTELFRLLLLIFLGFITSFALLYTGCLAVLFIPVIIFIIPYWLKERRIRRYLLNGFFVAILCFVLSTILIIYLSTSSPKPDLVEQTGTISLEHGTVDPFYGAPNAEYQFSIIYRNSAIIDGSNVSVNIEIFDYSSQKTYMISMVADTSGSSENGWLFLVNKTLPEGIYWFAFRAETVNSDNVTTMTAYGPINASFTTHFVAFTPYILFSLVLPFSMYYIFVGLYWWIEKAKELRGMYTPPTPPQTHQIKGEFECTNCGAEVSADATKCPRCGVVFDEEDVSQARADVKDKESNVAAQGKTRFDRKER